MILATQSVRFWDSSARPRRRTVFPKNMTVTLDKACTAEDYIRTRSLSFQMDSEIGATEVTELGGMAESPESGVCPIR